MPIESFEMYEGEVFLEFNSGNHQYKVRFRNGRSFKPRSVTSICSIIDKSAPLMGWAVNNTIDFIRAGIAPGTEHAESYLEEIYALAKKESQRKKTEAAKSGSVVHEILSGEEFRSTGDDLRDAEVLRKASEAREWLANNEIEFLHIERPIYSRRYRYSGRLDGIARVGGVLSLLDWKTGKSVYPEFRLQTAAYVHAFEEEFPLERIEQRIILHLGEEGVVPHFYPRELLRQDFAAFVGAQKLSNQIQKIEKEERKKK